MLERLFRITGLGPLLTCALGSRACVFWPQSSQLHTFVHRMLCPCKMYLAGSVVQGAPQVFSVVRGVFCGPGCTSGPDGGVRSLGILGQTVVLLLSLGLSSASEGPFHGPWGIIRGVPEAHIWRCWQRGGV